MKPLAELSTYLRSWLRELRAQRQHATILEVETLGDIVAEGRTAAAALAATAHRARVADDEAATLLAKVLADGRVDLGEIPLLRRAQRHITTSASLDHDLAESLTLPAEA